jgi:DNA-binding HxlR family transcriptional regulator
MEAACSFEMSLTVTTQKWKIFNIIKTLCRKQQNAENVNVNGCAG